MIDYKRIHELKIDEWIWIIFIFLSILNIIGDECEKDYCIHHTKTKKQTSKTIFTFTIFSSLLIYIYLEYLRKQKLNNLIMQEKNTLIWELRCIGGLLVILATLLFLYCQIVEPDSVNPQIE